MPSFHFVNQKNKRGNLLICHLLAILYSVSGYTKCPKLIKLAEQSPVSECLDPLTPSVGSASVYRDFLTMATLFKGLQPWVW